MFEQEEAVSQRIKILIDKFAGGVQLQFAKKVGAHQTTIHELFGKRQNKAGLSLLQKILVALPQVEAGWLMLGEGEMLKPVPGQGTGTNNSVVSDATKKIIIDPRILSGDTSQGEQPGFSYPPAVASPKEVVGSLVEQIVRSASDIEELKAAVLKIQQQLKH